MAMGERRSRKDHKKKVVPSVIVMLKIVDGRR